jgi:hypothetical protein
MRRWNMRASFLAAVSTALCAALPAASPRSRMRASGAEGGVMGRFREPQQEGAGSSSGAAARPLRVSAERLFELARHLTERDREVALYCTGTAC